MSVELPPTPITGSEYEGKVLPSDDSLDFSAHEAGVIVAVDDNGGVLIRAQRVGPLDGARLLAHGLVDLIESVLTEDDLKALYEEFPGLDAVTHTID